MGHIPKPMHDVANRDGRSEKQSSHGKNKENGNDEYFGSPNMN